MLCHVTRSNLHMPLSSLLDPRCQTC